jgi:hypothetical protein
MAVASSLIVLVVAGRAVRIRSGDRQPLQPVGGVQPVKR